MNRHGTMTLCASLAAILPLPLPGTAAAAEYVVPPIMPVATAWQGRATAVVRVLDKLDAHVETLTLKAGQTGSYKSLSVTARSCMDRPDGLPADAAAFLDVQDRHGDVQPFSGWTFSREPAIGVFESPIYGVQLASCDGELTAPAAPAAPLLPPVPSPGSLAADDTAPGTASADTGSSVEVDTPAQAAPAQAAPPQAAPVMTPQDGDAGPMAPAAPPAAEPAQPDPVYPEGPPAPSPPPPTAPPP